MSKKTIILILVMLAVVFIYKIKEYKHDRYYMQFVDSRYIRYPELDTPFIIDYRKRYELNEPFNAYNILMYATRACAYTYVKNIPFQNFNFYRGGIPCTKKDVKNLKKLSDKGEAFAALIIDEIYDEDILKFDKIDIKKFADMGDANAQSAYYWNSKEMKYLEMAADNGHMLANHSLAMEYFRDDKISEFCSTVKQGMEKFGLESTIYYFLADSESSYAKTFFEQCGVYSAGTTLEDINTLESKLIQGFILFIDKDYYKAKLLFNEVYNSSDDIKLSANAEYCLGVMNYLGIGRLDDKELGKKLLKNSYNKGVHINIYNTIPSVVGDLLPEEPVGRWHLYNSCGRVINNEYEAKGEKRTKTFTEMIKGE